jgi:hypothetical protein
MDTAFEFEPGTRKLVSRARLEAEHFQAIARTLGVRSFRARKVGLVAARRAGSPLTVETHWDGRETANTAREVDWIVTNLTPQQTPLRDREGQLNTYVILAEQFDSMYQATGAQTAFGAVHRAKRVVEAIELPGGFDIVAPWGERQKARAGYLILNGDEVYGNNAETFRATYEAVGIE